MRSRDERVAAVMRVVRSAQRVAKDPGDLVDKLVRTTGLSREGVLLGLREHLETNATEEDAARLADTTIEASRVHVILSSNVFVAALRALAIAAAASPHVTATPSSREPHFAAALGADVVPRHDVSEGEVHVYGRGETIGEVRRSAREGVIVRGHGPGMGVAIVIGDVRSAARLLAKDIVPFDQRGCLSPRVALVVGDARAFADVLFRALQDEIPRGELSAEEKAEAEVYASTVAYAGELLRAPSHAVGVARSVIVPPPGRHLHVVALGSEAEIPGAMGPLARHVVAVGVTDLARAREWAPAHARVSAIGQMQKPPLDGPVDRRSVAGV